MSHVMKLALALVCFGSVATAADQSSPKVFRIHIKAQLSKLVPVPGVNGVVRVDGKPAIVDETVTLPLTDCGPLIDGGTTCGGAWSKRLTIEGQTSSFFVNVWNKQGTDRYSIILNLCRSGEDLHQCPALATSALTVHGTTVPELKIYPNQHTMPFFQPVLTVSTP